MKQHTQIAIQDANILIDLVKVDLIHPCMQLSFQFGTTDLILDELYGAQASMLQPFIDAGKIRVTSPDVRDIDNIVLLQKTFPKLSIPDCSGIIYAEQVNGLLMTGDALIRKVAEKKNIAVCGIIGVLDELVQQMVLSFQEACHFIRQLININPRLPKMECLQRVQHWCG